MKLCILNVETLSPLSLFASQNSGGQHRLKKLTKRNDLKIQILSIPPKGLIISFYNEGHNHNHPQGQSFLVLPLLIISRQPRTTSHLWPSEEREVGEVDGGKGGNNKQMKKQTDIQREEMYLEISISSEIRDNSVSINESRMP